MYFKNSYKTVICKSSNFNLLKIFKLQNYKSIREAAIYICFIVKFKSLVDELGTFAKVPGC